MAVARIFSLLLLSLFGDLHLQHNKSLLLRLHGDLMQLVLGAIITEDTTSLSKRARGT